MSKPSSQHRNSKAVLGAVLFPLLAFLLPPAFANVVGSDAQNFNPTTSGLDFVTVQSAETLDTGVFNLGVFANYARNAFPYYQSANGGETAKRNTALTAGDLNFGAGLMRGWDFGASFPLILDQKTSDSSGHYSANGNTEVRVNSKFHLLGTSREGVALITSANFNRINHNPYLGEGGGPILNLELAGQTMLNQISLALNLGYRWRNPGQPVVGSGIEPLSNQWLASAALSYLVENLDSKLILEVVSAFPEKSTGQTLTDRQQSVVEGNLGIKYDRSANVAVHLGLGAGLIKGIASPDFRVYTGLNISFAAFQHRRSPVGDPYAHPRPHRVHHMVAVRAAQEPKPQKPAPAPTPSPPPPPTPATPPAPAPSSTKAAAAAESADEISPARKTETIHEVKVFDRGSFNHIVLNSIEFVASSKSLQPDSERYLRNDLLPALRELNKRRPIGSIVIEGHTDSVGEYAYNLALSEARAAVVGDLLRRSLGLNIPILTVGMGSSRPIADNGNFQGRALNRRVEIRILYSRTRP